MSGEWGHASTWSFGLTQTSKNACVAYAITDGATGFTRIPRS